MHAGAEACAVSVSDGMKEGPALSSMGEIETIY